LHIAGIRPLVEVPVMIGLVNVPLPFGDAMSRTSFGQHRGHISRLHLDAQRQAGRSQEAL
jgi:hypothetical protein